MIDPEPIPGVAFEVVTLLEGFTMLSKRSGELDGNLPVRAARYCGPVFEGNTAGFQISLAQPMTVARTRRGDVECVMTDPALVQVTQQVDEALEKGIQAGLLARDGFWHRLFRGNALPTRGRRLLIWTGHLVRPQRGIWGLVGGAYNRRSRTVVVDHLVTDPEDFVPLVIEIDTRGVTREPIWMEAEIGCLTPLVPAVTTRKEGMLAGAPELRQFAEFFSEAYFETKAKHPTANYVKCQRERRVKAEDHCDARLLYIGPDIHQVQEPSRFATPKGFSRTPSSPGVLQFSVVRNIAPTRWIWQGQTQSLFEVRKERHLPALHTIWRETFGDTQPSALEFLEGHLMGEAWDQPYVQYQPWVFGPTAPGWSTLVDGFHHSPAYDGMRAVIATDWFAGLAMVYRLFDATPVVIPFRAPMLRAIPVPRSALTLGIRESVL